MKIPEAVAVYLKARNLGDVTQTQSVRGGCISNGMRIWLNSGVTFFLKINPSAPRGMFAAEAAGLRALHVPNGVRVPQVYIHTPTAILLEDLNPATPANDYWVRLGHQLAAIHQNISSQFGFAHDNYIGSTPQPNPRTNDGHEFFGEHRLLFQAWLAHANGWFTPDQVDQVAALVARLPKLIPAQPASLLHGDLWLGNIIADSNGQPALIDPAGHYGWAETDLAMMTLFGSPPEVFFRAYQEKSGLNPNFRERFPIYNLYHILNHLNLFGGGYYDQAMQILSKFL